MSTRRTISPRVGIVLMAALLLFGILRLYDLRLSKGDAYPFHSSLRTDPMGTRLLHDAIQRAGAATTLRNYEALDTFEPTATNDVLLLIGTAMSMWPDIDWTPKQTARQLSTFMTHGGHLFIALAPTYEKPDASDDDTDTPDDSTSGTNTTVESSAADDAELSRAEQRERHQQERKQERYKRMSSNNWDTATWLGLAATYERRTPGTDRARRSTGAPPSLPDTLPCRTDAVLHKLSPDWTVLYERKGLPVFATRPYGNGHATVTTLSYFLSNQALRDDRHTPVLTWMIGTAPHVIFDETHLGLQSRLLTAELLRQNRLHWVLAVLAAAGLLFVWGASTSLLPKHGHRAEHTPVIDTTHDSNRALVSLLRRHIPPARLLPILVEQWASRGDGRAPVCAEALTTAQEVAEEQSRAKAHAAKNLLPLYNELTRQATAARKGSQRLSPTSQDTNISSPPDTHERRDT